MAPVRTPRSPFAFSCARQMPLPRAIAPACEAFIRLIRESDAELAREREEAAAGQGAASAESDDGEATDAAPAAPAGSASSDSVDFKDGE